MSDLLSLVHATYDALNARDLDAVRPYFAEDVETVTPGGTLRSLDEWQAMGQAFMAAAPDMHHEIVRTFEDGDTIVVEGIYSGTQTGALVGPTGTLPPSGQAFAFPYVDFFRTADGKIVSHRIYWDNLGFMSQLGALAG
jgi:steroid delta-isomerase-like uncharacterized protein